MQSAKKITGGGKEMPEKSLEQFIAEMEESTEVLKMESSQSDLFDVLMGRCPPTIELM